MSGELMKKFLSIASTVAITSISLNGAAISDANATVKKSGAVQRSGRTPISPSNTILHGTGAPSSELGINGDFYIDLGTYNIYGPKKSGRWPSPVSLKGSVGAQGPAGPQGVAGKNTEHATNVSSQTVTGPQGPQGERGARGDTGPAGPAGTAGAQGPLGPQGIQGVQGLKGDKGDTGPAGNAGFPGGAGPVGPKGDQGAAGAKGDAGPIGLTGQTGQQGIQGPVGLTGATGATGATGQQGIQGPIGLTGPKGDTGPIGLTGDIGPVGPKGDIGPSKVSAVLIGEFDLATFVANGTTTSRAIGLLKANGNYYFTIVLNGKVASTQTIGATIGINLNSKNADDLLTYEVIHSFSRFAYANSDSSSRHSVLLVGTLKVGNTDSSLAVTVVDPLGSTGAALSGIAFTGTAFVQEVGSLD